jgi:hypothetical protein
VSIVRTLATAAGFADVAIDERRTGWICGVGRKPTSQIAGVVARHSLRVK